MSTLRDYFAREGRIIELTAANPLLLTDSDKVWMTLTGSVDLFWVEHDGQGNSGAREYFYTAEAGQGALALCGDSLLEQHAFLAVGYPGTTVAELSLERFREFVAEAQNTLTLTPLHEYTQFIDDFLQGLATGLTQEITPTPRGQTLLPASGELSLPKSTYASAHKQVVWLQSDSPLLYLDMETVTTVQQDIYFPVTAQAWVLTLGDSAVCCKTTAELLQSDELWTALASYRETVFQILDYNLRFMMVDRYNAMAESVRQDERSMVAGLGKLADVLESQQQYSLTQDALTQGGNEEFDEDKLVAACGAITVSLSMPLVLPKQKKQTGFSVEDIASASGLRCRRVSLQGEWWRYESGELLAFLDEKPVAILPHKGKYLLYDPATQSRTRLTEQLAQRIDEQAYRFYAAMPAQPVSGLGLLRFGLKQCGQDVHILLLLGAAVGLLALVPLLLMAVVFDQVVPYAERERLLQMMSILLACAVGAAGLEYVRNLAALRITSRMHESVESAVMDRVLRLPLAFFRTQTAGNLAERVLGLTRVREVVTSAFVASVLGGLFALINLGLLFYYHAQLAWWIVLGMSLYLLIIGLGWRVQLRYRRALTQVEGKLSGKVFQFITGLPKLRANGGEGRAFSIWAQDFAEQRTLAYKAGLIAKWQTTLNSVVPVLAIMGLLIGIVSYMPERALPTGVFVAFNSAFANLLFGLLQITMAMSMVVQVWPYAERVKPILQAVPESAQQQLDPGELSGQVAMTNVSFRYHPDAPLVLKNISLTIKPGEFVALVGPSGSGKSSLIRLLLGFDEPTNGSVSFDDIDLSDLDTTRVRQNMGVVIQNSAVTPGSILKNIIGSQPLTLDDAWAAARLVGLEADIKDMPMGMHTVVPEGGGTFSGGQRQRLILARALVNRPRILLLDEATSALDNKTQAIVSESLEKIKATRIVVAHRLSTIRNADRIIVLEQGEIRESGSYESLVAEEGLFYRLVQRQLLAEAQ